MSRGNIEMAKLNLPGSTAATTSSSCHVEQRRDKEGGLVILNDHLQVIGYIVSPTYQLFSVF